ncbi:Piso0_003674 [Millerozyma farinosa CBS 7064]|uniref:Piso0_003674 protein n=1 Tax=Pichia sorbitophila (strain ATCC MYA-4447 / BCRC 22081 / CBS 7064 / NBRC 10061 / NRRL Y-12695) TaxID=559304 RepID=G8YGK3_PICSO|nr:Piso0_003674 [Millerozyma farinosa CBS 7064]CCE81320.1 Piso0_003674 [Millerozyma farinosa CBS 7064]
MLSKFIVSFVASGLFSLVFAGDLGDIKHVVLFMQENRAFDHYYGTMAGVRGFQDPNALKRKDNSTVWQQPTGKKESKYLLPFYLNEDKDYAESNQCSLFGSNDWTPNHKAWNNGTIDGWVTGNSPYSWSYFKRGDIPTHFSIVEGWTVADMYAESVIGPTCPNRVSWVTGTINVPGSPPGKGKGGPYIENYETPGCQKSSNGEEYSCFPLKWKTFPEYLEEAKIDWYVFQDKDNFDDDPFAWFQQYQNNTSSDIYKKGRSYSGLDDFYHRAANGSLPPVSYIVGPQELSEHPPWMPKDGAWLQQKVVEAVMKSPKYNETALLISYDETGGLGDHVPPFISPPGTKGEWFYDPEDLSNYVPSGPGFRVPFYVISPWTRGGKVYTAPSDHSSQILFLEQWIQKRYNKTIITEEVNPWRREHMANLVDMFDFENPDYSLPKIVDAETPKMSGGKYVGTTSCEAKYSDRQAKIPYGNQTLESALYTEKGYKQIRGNLTEGRYLAFKSRQTGKCLESSSNSSIQFGDCSKNYDSDKNLFIVEQVGNYFSSQFKLKTKSGSYLKNDKLTKDSSSATIFNIGFDPKKGYSIKGGNNLGNFDIFSVS